MDYLDVSLGPSGFHIEGFPDAVKVIGLKGPKARRLSDLALHRADLAFALSSLEAINSAPPSPSVVRQALWRSALIHVFKCFGDSKSRFQLDPKRVLRGQPPLAFEVFQHFKELRNRHYVHDENSVAQSLPGAILNARGKPCKIAKIVCSSVFGDMLGQDAYSGLHKLITTTQDWVTGEFDRLCDELTKELEEVDYDALLQMDGLTYEIPKIEDVALARKRP